jgi:thymidylate synthase ThyX
MTESLNPSEIALLANFVTNTDRSIFALRNLPEVVKGTLFSRYSRSEKGLRQILLDEFVNVSESGFAEIVGESPSNAPQGEEQMIATQKAEAFYDRVLIGYGDDSVAELGGAHIACEEISNIASIAIEDSRLGLSPLEKSTRYVPFDRQIDGKYRYYREPSIMASSHGKLYEETLDFLFDTYTNLIEPLIVWIQTQTPKDDNTSDRAYHHATKAKALDLLRGLLPMATLTNVGLFGNGRAFEYLLVKLAASPHQEIRTIGCSMQGELDKIIPSFVKRAKSDRGAEYAKYLANNRENIKIKSQNLTVKNSPPNSGENAILIDWEKDAESKIVTAILYPHDGRSWSEIAEDVATLDDGEKLEIINAYIGDRQSRFHRPGRAFEEVYYTFDILGDLGAYRDLHRHRICTQERQSYTVEHGYVLPPELIAAGLADTYSYALEQAATAFHTIFPNLPAAAQYLVPFAYRVRWRMKFNLREAYHLIELRSARQGHSSYREIAQEMYRQIQKVHPNLAAGMQFVDLNNYHLERLAAEQKLDAKLAKQNPSFS